MTNSEKKRAKHLAAIGAIVVAVAYLAAPHIARAVGDTTVMGKGSDGFPRPIGATGDRLKVTVGPDGLPLTTQLVGDGGVSSTRTLSVGITVQGVPLAGTVTDAGFTPNIAVTPAAGSPGTGPTTPSYGELVDQNGTALFARSNPGYIVPIAPDGGIPLFAPTVGGAAVTAANPLPTSEQVPTTSTLSCLEALANTSGDGGTLSPTVGTLYELIMEGGNGNARMANSTGCTAYAGGVGQILNDSTDKYFRPKTAPDGGAPYYTLCAATGTVRVQLCLVQ